jgi:hypothetical protein
MSNIHDLWPLAAEMAAFLGELARWDWSAEATEAASLAEEVAEGLYAGRPLSAAPFAALDDLFGDLASPRAFFAGVAVLLSGQGPDANDCVERAGLAYLRLRSELFPEGRPEAA